MMKITEEQSVEKSKPAGYSPLRNAEWAMWMYGDDCSDAMDNVVHAVQNLVADLKLEVGREAFDREEKSEIVQRVMTLLLRNVSDSLGMKDQARALLETLK